MKPQTNAKDAKPLRAIDCMFLVKSTIAIALLLGLRECIESLPALLIVMIWAASSAVLAVGIAYPYCIRKISNCEMYMDESMYLKRADKRGGRLAICYALALILTSGLLIESMRWEACQFAIAAASIPLYALISLLVRKLIIEKEFKPLYRQRALMLWSRIITGIILTALFTAAAICTSNGTTDILSTLTVTDRPFYGPESNLISFLGGINYLTTSAISYGTSNIASINFWLFAGVKLFLCVSSSFALAQLLSLCSLHRNEWTRIFLPIVDSKDPSTRSRTIFNSAASLMVVTILFACSFMLANHAAGKIPEEIINNTIDDLIKNSTNVVYESEESNKLIDEKSLEGIFNETAEGNADYINRKQTLIQEVDKAYNACEGNIDVYLEQRHANPLVRFFRNLFSESIFNTTMLDGVDIRSYASAVNDYNNSIRQIKDQVEDEIDSPRFQGIAIKDSKNAKPLDAYFASKLLDPTFKLSDPVKSGVLDEDATDEEYREALQTSIEMQRKAMLERLQ